jgi:hypothetical protein
MYPSIPDEKQRAEAWERLSAFMDRVAERVRDVPEDEVEAAIQEAIDHVHRYPRWESSTKPGSEG